MGGFIARWWRWALLVPVLVVAALGAMAWKSNYDEDRKAAELRRRYAAEAAFVEKQCGRGCVSAGPVSEDFSCTSQNLERFYPCRTAAIKRFAEEWGKSVR